MGSVPVSIRLSHTEFDQLEAIAEKRGMTVRQLLQAHVRAGLQPRVVRPVTATQHPARSRGVTEDEVNKWVSWAEAGMTNNEIAARSGVSKSLVSRYLIEKGLRRHSRRAS
jgi:transcriptional regulator with XRE-family HTH domain